MIKKKINIYKIDWNSKKNKKLKVRIMCFIVMSTFSFSSGFNKVYATSDKSGSLSMILGDNSKNKEKSTENLDEIIEDNNKEITNGNSNNKYYGTNEEGKKYTYDAAKISKKLKNEDYTNEGKKIVFLTFDDGASNTVTPKILKILDQYKVKATFFVVGKTIEDGGETAKELVKEEFDNGHAIGSHSYSHDYNILYPGRSLNLESFKIDYKKNNDLLKEILGEEFSTRVIRCPGRYMSWKNMSQLDKYLDENNMTTIDWSALSGDAEGKRKNAQELFNYVVETSKGKEIVVLLMHDTYGKEETVKSLPKVIEYFKNQSYDFKTLS